MKVKVEIEMEEITTDTHGEHPKGLKEPTKSLKLGFSGGCSCEMKGTDCYWTAASGNKYLHRLCSGAQGDCVSGWVFFWHTTGVSGWHYCP